MKDRLDLKNKSKQEMATMLAELKAKLAQFGFDLAEKKLKNTNQIKMTKKDIARILTIVNSQDKNPKS